LINMLGGTCVRCGTTEDLEFDHIDPATKRFAICADLTRAWSELLAEVAKCQEATALPASTRAGGLRPVS
jgi:hypothetical protein